MSTTHRGRTQNERSPHLGWRLWLTVGVIAALTALTIDVDSRTHGMLSSSVVELLLPRSAP